MIKIADLKEMHAKRELTTETISAEIGLRRAQHATLVGWLYQSIVTNEILALQIMRDELLEHRIER